MDPPCAIVVFFGGVKCSVAWNVGKPGASHVTVQLQAIGDVNVVAARCPRQVREARGSVWSTTRDPQEFEELRMVDG